MANGAPCISAPPPNPRLSPALGPVVGLCIAGSGIFRRGYARNQGFRSKNALRFCFDSRCVWRHNDYAVENAIGLHFAFSGGDFCRPKPPHLIRGYEPASDLATTRRLDAVPEDHSSSI